MNAHGNNNASPSHKDGDGVRVIEHDTRRVGSALLYKLLALVLAACFVAYLIMMLVPQLSSVSNARSKQPVAYQARSSAESKSGTSLEASTMRDSEFYVRPVRSQGSSRDPNDLANYIAPGQAPKMQEVIERLHEAGIYSGLGAFNPPGTSPPMIGLAVPDDYVLPEGYVRHFQATDDGQRIKPILMYSPDFEFFDSAGQPINIPDNRVVPGNMAPPGLAIRPIEIPDPLEPGGP
jgi:hypothetical protein